MNYMLTPNLNGVFEISTSNNSIIGESNDLGISGAGINGIACKWLTEM